jgi:Predicted membrane protein
LPCKSASTAKAGFPSRLFSVFSVYFLNGAYGIPRLVRRRFHGGHPAPGPVGTASGRDDRIRRLFHPLLILAATTGNILGSTANWVLGRYFSHLKERRWFPIKKAQLEKAGHWYHKYGRWSLLLSWVPIIGDPLTLLAGILREPLPSFLAIVAIAKLGRYLAVAGAALGLTGF